MAKIKKSVVWEIPDELVDVLVMDEDDLAENPDDGDDDEDDDEED